MTRFHPRCLLTLLAAIGCTASAGAQDRTRQDPAATTAVIRGQCVAAEHLLPLAGCVVTASAHGRRKAAAGPDAAQCPAPVATGADGRFELRVPARLDLTVQLRIEKAGRGPQAGRRIALQAGKVYDTGTVALRRGNKLRGKVVTESGQPLSATLEFVRVVDRIGGIPEMRMIHVHPQRPRPVPGLPFPLQPEQVNRAPSADGSFESAAPLPPGTYRLRVRGQPQLVAEPTRIVIAKSPPPPSPHIIVRELHHLSGIVVDATGAPVTGVRLRAEQTRYGPGMRATTKADGRFKIYRTGYAAAAVRIMIENPGRCEPRGRTAAFAWGRHDIRIELQSSPVVQLTVVTTATGKPIEEFAVRAYPLDARADVALTRLRLAGRHPGGVVRVDGVRLGPGRIAVVPKDPTLLPTTIDVVGAHGMKPLRIQVQRLVPMQLSLVDDQGRPVVGASVRVVVPGNYDRTRVLLDAREPFVRGRSQNPRTTFDTVIYTTTADANGQCVAYGIDGRDDLVLAVTEGGLPPQRVPGVTFGKASLSRRVIID